MVSTECPSSLMKDIHRAQFNNLKLVNSKMTDLEITMRRMLVAES
jgi:hypothetical protein